MIRKIQRQKIRAQLLHENLQRPKQNRHKSKIWDAKLRGGEEKRHRRLPSKKSRNTRSSAECRGSSNKIHLFNGLTPPRAPTAKPLSLARWIDRSTERTLMPKRLPRLLLAVTSTLATFTSPCSPRRQKRHGRHTRRHALKTAAVA